MKLEKIYEELSVAIETNNTSLLVGLKENLRVAVLNSENKTSSKTRLNTMLRAAKKAGERRPALGRTPILEDGRQLFTDGYFLVKLVKEDQKLAMNTDLNGVNYPRTDRIIDQTSSGHQISFKVSVKDLLNQFKLNKIAVIKYNDDKVIAIEKENTKNFITFMNYKPNDIITFNAPDEFSKEYTEQYVNSLVRPMYATKENGTFGLMFPIKFTTYKEKLEEKNLIIPIEVK